MEEHVIPFPVQHYGSTENMAYQQDNFGLHRPKSVREFMDAKQINLMTWPFQSPDSNPIEDVWAIMKKK